MDVAALLEVVTIGSACAWLSGLLCRPGVLPPHRALMIGVAGTVLGSHLWAFIGLPAGPSLDGHPLLPVFCGSFLVFIAVTLFDALRVPDPTTPRSVSVNPWKPERSEPEAKA